MNGGIDWVVKIGGRALVDDDYGREALSVLARDLTQARKSGLAVAVVHGGGPAINEELARRGIIWNFVGGLRVTTPEMIGVIESVLAGAMNSRVVRALQAAGADAVGLSGVDGGMLFCSQMDPRLECVGEIDEVRGKWLSLVASNGGIPVVAPIGVGAEGERYNINADWAAAKIATALRAKRLAFMTDQNGILKPSGETIESISEPGLATLVEEAIVTGGMLAKVQTIRHALRNGVPDVRVANSCFGLTGCAGTACTLTSFAPEIATEVAL